MKYVRLRENFLRTPSFLTAYQVPLSSNANRLEFSECVVYIIVLKKKNPSNLILAIKQSGHIDFFFHIPLLVAEARKYFCTGAEGHWKNRPAELIIER